MKARIKRDGQDVWKEHSEAWKASGISQRTYCKQAGINYHSFVYQHNRLESQSKKAPTKFIEAKPESAVIGSNASAGIQLMLPNGIRVGIGADINPVLLQRVLEVAGAVPC